MLKDRVVGKITVTLSVISVISVISFGMKVVREYNRGNTAIQYYNCVLKDNVVGRIKFLASR